MLHANKTTPFMAIGTEWEMVSFQEIPDQVFVRMIRPGGMLSAFDGKLRSVKFKPNHGVNYPCFYVKTIESRGSKTICIPSKEWREHNEH